MNLSAAIICIQCRGEQAGRCTGAFRPVMAGSKLRMSDEYFDAAE